MLYQWLNIPIIEVTNIGYIIETLENVKILITSHNHNQHLLLYIMAELLSAGLAMFIRVPKVLYISYNMGN